MLSVSSLISAPPVANATFSTLAVAAPDRVSTRLTPIAVSAPLPDERVTDNNQQRALLQAPVAQTRPQATPQNTSSPDSATYVTLSQGNAQTNAVLESVSAFAPALQYNKLVGYSLVRYRPSNAGLPTETTNTPSSTEAPSSAPLPNATEYRAYNNTQLRNLSELANSSPPVLI